VKVGNYQGIIVKEPATNADPIFVIIPTFSETQEFGPCRWTPSAVLPEVGDACLVSFDNLDVPWVLSYQKSSPFDFSAHPHAASAVTLLDSAGDFTATNIETALAELRGRERTPGGALWAGRQFFLVEDGTSHVLVQNPNESDSMSGFGVNWDDLVAGFQGATVQWRVVFRYNVEAINGATDYVMSIQTYCEARSTGASPGWRTLTSHNPSGVPTGVQIVDSGWGTPPDTSGWGIYIPGYLVDYVTAAPTITGLNVAFFTRVT